MSMRVALLVCFVLEGAWTLAADIVPDWDSLAARNSYVEFVDRNQRWIVNLTNMDSLDRAGIRGLEVSDAELVDWSTLGLKLTNVVCLRVTSSSTNLAVALFSAITNFSRLEYLHLQCRQALTIPSSVNVLTNLLQLRYLGIDAPATVRIDSGIYQIRSLRELFLVVGSVDLPDGIARLAELKRLEIHGRHANPVRSLPADLAKSAIEELEIANIPGVEKLIPGLPPDLVHLRVIKCQLRDVPNAWLKNRRLKVVDLSNNELADFPTGLLSIPSLKLVCLDLNAIMNVPPLSIGDDRQLKITLTANPIQGCASENEPLVQRGVIEK